MGQQTLKVEDFTPAWTQEMRQKALGQINRMFASQAVAADANVAFQKDGSVVVTEPGFIRDLQILFPVLPAADEVMSIDVHVSRAGAAYATILSAPRVYGLVSGVAAATATIAVRERMSLMDLVTGRKDVAVGDRIRLVVDYTVGGGPTPMVDTTCFIDISK